MARKKLKRTGDSKARAGDAAIQRAKKTAAAAKKLVRAVEQTQQRADAAQQRSDKAHRKADAAHQRAEQSTPRPRVQQVLQTARPKAKGASAQRRPDLAVLGVGASAGGLEAFKQLLSHLAPDTGLAIVLVQHLSPDHVSVLPELLGDSTAMPVRQVTDEMQLEPNHVYVIPPDRQMRLEDGHLRLVARQAGRFNPIDVFFRSMAEHARERGIGLVLSGTGSDGADGLRQIKAAGGIALAQEPKTAQYDGMPRAAIATGVVDLVRSPEQLAVEMARLAGQAVSSTGKGDPAGDELLISDEQLQRIHEMLRGATGVDFANYKQPTLKRRLQRRMALHQIDRVPKYIRYMEQHPAEVDALYRDILIHVTRFFREPESFDALGKVVFPRIREQRHGQEPIRIWVPGCSTGEEVYSVAIALVEFLGDEAGSVPVQIFGTDLSESAVEHARAGVYAEGIAADVSPERLRRFFAKTDGGYRIAKTIREMCVFARQDLTRDPPFSNLDLVVCRNVLIYLGPVLQKKLIGVFHYALKPNGFLMLGSAETVGQHPGLFQLEDKRHRIYMVRPAAFRAEVMFEPASLPQRPAAAPPRGAAENRSGSGVQAEAARLILNRYGPPGVIVDSELQIVHSRGQTGPFLELAPGEASLSILKMAREGLVYALRSALHEARKNDRPVRKEGLKVQGNGQLRDVNLDLIPLTAPGEQRHFLVLFEEVTHKPSPNPLEPSEPQTQRGRSARGKQTGDGQRVEKLQQELAGTREYLQSIIQDLEADNEELQSANEEILSSNEELQSTNEELDTAREELQSTNEEINTVNEELHARNEELSRVNSDLVNLLASVQIAIVIVDNELRIRRFTPVAEEKLNLIPTDIGRRISDIKPNIDCPDLEKLIAEVIEKVVEREREVRDARGHWFTLRIRPYKSVENRIDGAVLTLFDISARKQHEAQVQAEQDLSSAIAQTVRHPLVVLDSRMHLRMVNRAFSRAFGLDAEAVLGQPLFELAGGQWNVPQLRELLEKVLPRNQKMEDVAIDADFGGRVRRLLLNARRVEPEVAGEALILLAIEPMIDPADA